MRTIQDFKDRPRTYLVDILPKCSLCALVKKNVDAEFNAKMKSGSWAFMCQCHFEAFGDGLGLGKGQRLVLR